MEDIVPSPSLPRTKHRLTQILRSLHVGRWQIGSRFVSQCLGVVSLKENVTGDKRAAVGMSICVLENVIRWNEH